MGLATQNIDFTYDKLSQLKKIDRSVTTNPGHLVTDYQYDGAGRLFDINNKFNTTVISNYNYSYDDGNRLSGKSGTDGISTIDYGKDNQISGVNNTNRPDEAYSFNALGIRAGWVTDTLDKRRVLNDGTYQYQYDNEGNLTQKTEIATSKVTAYTWDYRNRLTSVTSGNQTVEYGYDAEDQRVSKKINGVVKEKYVYDGEDIALVVDAAGTLVERYLYGAGVDNVLSRVSAGTTIWSLGDRQGSVVDLVDEGGAVLNHFVYDSFGNRTTATGVDFRFGYTGRELDTETGRELDTETGLYYYRARYYDPSVGRFISEDPIGFGAGDTNLYRYVGNNSTNATAPTGLYSFDDFGRDAWNFGQGIGRNFDYSFDAINTHVFSPVGNAVVKPVVNAVNTNFITPFNNAASNAVGFYTDLVNEGQREGGVVGTFKQGAGIFGGTLASTPGAVGSFAQNNSTRIGGLFQAIGGAGEIYAGATTSATIFGAPVGALLAANGVDNFQAGLRKLFTGEDANTLLYDATKRLTGSDKLAGTVDAATGLVLNAAAASAAAKQAAAQRAAAVANDRGLNVASDSIEGLIDYYGRPITQRTQSILDRFQSAKNLPLEDSRGNITHVYILEGLNSNIRVKDLGKLQAATGHEYILLRGPTGDRVLIRGSVNANSIPEAYIRDGYKWSGHSHPSNITPSSSDREVLRAFSQEQSVIVDVHGRIAPFSQYEDLSNWLP